MKLLKAIRDFLEGRELRRRAKIWRECDKYNENLRYNMELVSNTYRAWNEQVKRCGV